GKPRSVPAGRHRAPAAEPRLAGGALCHCQRAAAAAAGEWTLFGVTAWVIFLAMLVLPGLGRRRRLAQAVARLLVRLTRTPLQCRDGSGCPPARRSWPRRT